jgi:hypothetical protein
MILKQNWLRWFTILPASAFIIFTFFSCSKSKNNNNHSDSTTFSGYGHFGFNDYSAGFDGAVGGWPDTGAGRLTGNIDITIFESNPIQGSLTVYNMPSADTGTFAIADAEDIPSVIGSAQTYVSCTGYPYAEDTIKYSTSGTVTKTGSKSFTFMCTIEGFDFPNPTTGYGYY